MLSGQTGVLVSTHAEFQERRARHLELDAETARVAGALAAGGVDPYRPGAGFAVVGLVSGLVKPAEREYRHKHILPVVAAALRAPVANALELYLSLYAPGARYGVFTGGRRCQVEEVHGRVRALVRKLSRWHHVICKPFGIDVLFRGVELTVDADLTFHPHVNLLYVLDRYLRPREWRRFLSQSRAFLGAHWQDNGPLRDVREVVKYFMKGDDLDRLVRSHPAVLVELSRQVERCRLVEPLGSFRVWHRDLKHAGLRVVPILEDGERKLIAVKRRERRPGEASVPKPGGRLPRTNRILCFGLPRALHGPHKEPVALVENLDLDTLFHDPVVMEQSRRATRTWTSKGLLPPPGNPFLARSALKVHTTTVTVRAADAGAGVMTAEKAAAHGHPP